MSNKPMKIGFTYRLISNEMDTLQKKYAFHIEEDEREVVFDIFYFDPFSLYPQVIWKPLSLLKDEKPWYCATELLNLYGGKIIYNKWYNNPNVTGKKIIANVRDGYLSQQEEIAKLKVELEVCNRTIESLKKQLDKGYKGYRFAAGRRDETND